MIGGSGLRPKDVVQTPTTIWSLFEFIEGCKNGDENH